METRRKGIIEGESGRTEGAQFWPQIHLALCINVVGKKKRCRNKKTAGDPEARGRRDRSHFENQALRWEKFPRNRFGNSIPGWRYNEEEKC